MRQKIRLAAVLVSALGLLVFFCSAASAGNRKIGSEDDLLEALAVMREKQAVGFQLTLTKEYILQLTGNEGTGFSMIALKAGMTDYRMQYSSAGDLKLDDVSWTEPHVAECATEPEFRRSVQRLLEEGVPSCQIVVTDRSVFQSLLDGNRVFSYAAMYGAENVSVRHSLHEPYVIYLDAITYCSVPWKTVAGEEEWIAAAEEMASRNITCFCLVPEPAFGAKLLKDEALLRRLEGAYPVYLYSYSCSQEAVVRATLSAVYPGIRIVSAAAAGDLSALTPREKETLAAAQSLAERCRQGDPLSTAQALHDALCQIIVYTDDPSTDEDDSATGALLNGRANCDGYSDAFYLAGTMAGLEVRFQHGTSRKADDSYRNVAHMWNLLKIDGSWRLVDVTWDDQENGPVRIWFNIGADRARKMHKWDEETSVPLLPETVLSERPENEFYIRDLSGVYSAAKHAGEKQYASFTLVLSDKTTADGEAVLNELSSALNSSFLYSWNEYMRTMTVFFQ